MKLILAQGNPGKQYERTRHNIGFMALDALAASENAPWKPNARFKADVAEFSIGSEKVLLAKPSSFYNETGNVARAIIDFYKLDPSRDFLVIHDDLALPFGTIRVREKGSDAGNNGIKSLNSHLGEAYARIRIGVWNELRDQMDDASFVLSAFSATEANALNVILNDTVSSLITSFVDGRLEAHSQKLKLDS